MPRCARRSIASAGRRSGGGRSDARSEASTSPSERWRLAALVTGIADDALDEGEGPSGLSQQVPGSIPILHARGMHVHRQQQTQRVRQDVALTANHLLARVIAGRVERGPPLRAPRALWLSMMAVVGLASRPAFSRTST